MADRRVFGLSMTLDALEHGVQHFGGAGLIGGQHRPVLHVIKAVPRLVGTLANERAAKNRVAVFQGDDEVADAGARAKLRPRR